jgi:hypothetical protein
MKLCEFKNQLVLLLRDVVRMTKIELTRRYDNNNNMDNIWMDQHYYLLLYPSPSLTVFPFGCCHQLLTVVSEEY